MRAKKWIMPKIFDSSEYMNIYYRLLYTFYFFINKIWICEYIIAITIYFLFVLINKGTRFSFSLHPLIEEFIFLEFWEWIRMRWAVSAEIYFAYRISLENIYPLLKFINLRKFCQVPIKNRNLNKNKQN